MASTNNIKTLYNVMAGLLSREQYILFYWYMFEIWINALSLI